jgi:3-hydroxyisobutyrate dehydrogenase-like beta-hydroxyacid dehydrogenase
MARNLISAGFDLVGWARRPETAAAAVASGIALRATATEMAGDRDFVITMVTTSKDVIDLALKEGGLLDSMPRGSVLIDMSTVAPSASRRLGDGAAERGIDFLDAPVSGGSFGAEAASLTIMVGGHAEVLDRCRPIFAAVGDPQRLFHVGPVGSGEVAKLVNNMLVGAISAATMEALLVGVRAGVPLQALIDVISVSSGASMQLSGQLVPRALSGELRPGFATDLLVKDLMLARDIAQELGQETSIADVALRLFEASQAAGHGGEDYSALARELETADAQLRL